MTNHEIERLLGELVRSVPEQLTGMGFARDTCILHTRVAVNALRAQRVPVRPLAVRVVASNAAYARDTCRLGRFPGPGELSPDAWTVGIGYGRPEDATRPGFDGHVIAVVKDRWALDLTIDQASRPQHGMVYHPHFWGAVTRAFLRGDEPDVFVSDGGAFLRYEAMPDERGYLRAGDWRNAHLAVRVRAA